MSAQEELQERAAGAINSACREFIARRKLGELLYARLEADLRGEPRPAVRNMIRRFPVERTKNIVALQRRFRRRNGGPGGHHGHPGKAQRRDDLAALTEAIEAAGLYFALSDQPYVIGRSFVSQLDKPFDEETAAQLSLDDINELAAVLSRNIASLKSDLQREEQLKADLTEQCERRERLIEQIVTRVGKHYSARKQSKKRAGPQPHAPAH